MKTFAILVAIASVVTVAAPTTVEAKGCMRGAAAGAVGGHYMRHHAVLGAIGGCMAGRAYYHHRARTAGYARTH
jgi:hypothetical protein